MPLRPPIAAFLVRSGFSLTIRPTSTATTATKKAIPVPFETSNRLPYFQPSRSTEHSGNHFVLDQPKPPHWTEFPPRTVPHLPLPPRLPYSPTSSPFLRHVAILQESLTSPDNDSSWQIFDSLDLSLHQHIPIDLLQQILCHQLQSRHPSHERVTVLLRAVASGDGCLAKDVLQKITCVFSPPLWKGLVAALWSCWIDSSGGDIARIPLEMRRLWIDTAQKRETLLDRVLELGKGDGLDGVEDLITASKLLNKPQVTTSADVQDAMSALKAIVTVNGLPQATEMAIIFEKSLHISLSTWGGHADQLVKQVEELKTGLSSDHAATIEIAFRNAARQVTGGSSKINGMLGLPERCFGALVPARASDAIMSRLMLLSARAVQFSPGEAARVINHAFSVLYRLDRRGIRIPINAFSRILQALPHFASNSVDCPPTLLRGHSIQAMQLIRSQVMRSSPENPIDHAQLDTLLKYVLRKYHDPEILRRAIRIIMLFPGFGFPIKWTDDFVAAAKTLLGKGSSYTLYALVALGWTSKSSRSSRHYRTPELMQLVATRLNEEQSFLNIPFLLNELDPDTRFLVGNFLLQAMPQLTRGRIKKLSSFLLESKSMSGFAAKDLPIEDTDAVLDRLCEDFPILAFRWSRVLQQASPEARERVMDALDRRATEDDRYRVLADALRHEIHNV